MAIEQSYQSAESTHAAKRAAAITPSDATDIENTRAIYIGVAGNLKVTMVGGGDVTFVGLVPGIVLPIQATRVWATGTTCTSLLALY